ncbi:MAG: hypothetical protein ACFFC7_33385 [Candidatus Hermodarchaeota archaeon]
MSVWAIGWLINPLDFFGWPGSDNLMFVLIEPLVFFISCTLACLTFCILVAKSISNSKQIFTGSLGFASIFGLYGLLLNAIRIQTAAYENMIKDENSVPFWGAWLSFLLLLFLFGLYLAWHDPHPKNDEELQKWYEYSAQTKIPVGKWMLIYWFFYFTLFTIFFAVFAIISDLILPNPFIEYYIEDGEKKYNTLALGMILFPGPFLHTISFIIYYWKPIRIKLDLFLLKHRKRKEEKDELSAEQEVISKEEVILAPKSSRQRLRRIFIIELGFIVILCILLLTLWLEAFISSLWALIFLLLLEYLYTPDDRKKILNQVTKRGQ